MEVIIDSTQGYKFYENVTFCQSMQSNAVKSQKRSHAGWHLHGASTWRIPGRQLSGGYVARSAWPRHKAAPPAAPTGQGTAARRSALALRGSLFQPTPPPQTWTTGTTAIIIYIIIRNITIIT